mgnify:FL=1
MVIVLALLLNTTLRALDSDNAMLADESTFFSEQIINEAELAFRYRPIGAAYAVPCLVVALGTAEAHSSWPPSGLHSRGTRLTLGALNGGNLLRGSGLYPIAIVYGKPRYPVM